MKRSEYVTLRRDYRDAEKSVLRTMLEPSNCLRFFTSGRLIRVRDGDTNWGWGDRSCRPRSQGP